MRADPGGGIHRDAPLARVRSEELGLVSFIVRLGEGQFIVLDNCVCCGASEQKKGEESKYRQ